MRTALAIGRVPSRRRYSLGINHIPFKHCPTSRVYLQVGWARRLVATRRELYPLCQILKNMERKVRLLREQALRCMIAQAWATWVIIEDLLTTKEIFCIQNQKEWFYFRSFLHSIIINNGENS